MITKILVFAFLIMLAILAYFCFNHHARQALKAIGLIVLGVVAFWVAGLALLALVLFVAPYVAIVASFGATIGSVLLYGLGLASLGLFFI